MNVARIQRDPNALASEVHSRIIDAMMAGHLVPGDRLILDELADQLGVSRTPVRDALLRLMSEGIVEAGDKRGYVFRELTDSEIDQNLEARIAIECHAAERLASMDAAAFNHVRAALADADRVPKDSVRASFEANRQVHRAIVETTENPQLLNFFDSTWGLAASNRIYHRFYQVRTDDSFRVDHERLIDDIAAGDPAAARAAMLAHIRGGRP